MGGPGNLQDPPQDLLDNHGDVCADWNCVYKDAAERKKAAASSQDGAEPTAEEEQEGAQNEEANAATRIQSMYRGQQAKAEVAQKRVEHGAAAKVQSGWRGMQGRKEAAVVKEKRQNIGRLALFAPFKLCNNYKAIIEVMSVEYFDDLSWHDFQCAMQLEFPTKEQFNVFYSTQDSPENYCNEVKEQLLVDLKEYRKVAADMAQITIDRAERQRVQAEEEEQKRQEKLARGEPVEKTGSEDEEEDPEDDPESSKMPKLSRKEREAVEAAEKQRRAEEKARDKHEAETEYRHKILEDKLKRFLELYALCINF